MVIGNPSVFAIESIILRAYQRLSFRALGQFVVHVKGRRYGVYEPDATMLAVSLDEISRRLSGRGSHTASFSSEANAERIATAYRMAVYSETQLDDYCGLDRDEFCKQLYASRICWAPYGDEAFDDHSHILHFDCDDRIRLIAFQSSNGYSIDRRSLCDLWLPATGFYGTLQTWHDAFTEEWQRLPKSSD